MKKLFFLIMAAMFAAVSFSACSDDDDKGNNINPSQIVGTWGVAHFHVTADGREEDHDILQSDEAWHRMIFTADGTITIEFVDEDTGDYFTTVTGNYSIEGNKLMLDYIYEGYSETDVKTITTLNSTTLVFEEVEQDNEYYKAIWTYKRL